MLDDFRTVAVRWLEEQQIDDARMRERVHDFVNETTTLLSAVAFGDIKHEESVRCTMSELGIRFAYLRNEINLLAPALKRGRSASGFCEIASGPRGTASGLKRTRSAHTSSTQLDLARTPDLSLRRTCAVAKGHDADPHAS